MSVVCVTQGQTAHFKLNGVTFRECGKLVFASDIVRVDRKECVAYRNVCYLCCAILGPGYASDMPTD